MPHPYFLDKGIYAVTLLGIQTKEANIKSERMDKVVKALMKSTRMLDQLDEQLHAGSKMYFLVNTNRLITINAYGLIVLCLMAPLMTLTFLPYYDHTHTVTNMFTYSNWLVVLATGCSVLNFVLFQSFVPEQDMCYPFD